MITDKIDPFFIKYKYYFIIFIILFNSFEIQYTNKNIIDNIYFNKINSICPTELENNIAGKEGLYFNTSDTKIKESIVNKYFHHCGAWCLFDYEDPRNGWYWNSAFRHWEYYKKIYLFCPQDEFHYALDKFFNKKNNH